MTVTRVDIAGDEFLATAAQAMRTSGGVGALDALGWWDLLAHLGETDLRTAVFAVFRAQGRELVSSPALGGLLAQPYLEAAGLEPGTVVATMPRASARGRPVLMAVGDVTHRMLLVDRPGDGATVAEPDAVVLRPVHLPGRLTLHEVDVDLSRAAVTIDEAPARAARERSAFLGRVAPRSRSSELPRGRWRWRSITPRIASSSTNRSGGSRPCAICLRGPGPTASPSRPSHGTP